MLFRSLAPNGDATKVKFLTAFNQALPDNPQVVVKAEEVPADKTPLGYVARVEGGKRYREIAVNEVVTIQCYAHNQGHVTALHWAMRAAMMGRLKWFTGAGYSGLFYLGGTDLEPEPDFMPEMLGIYRMQQRWQAQTQIPGADEAIPQKTALVAAFDVDADTDGNKGGITAPAA